MDTSNTLINNWPPSMAANDFFDRDGELDGIFNGDGSEAREEIQVGSETLSLAPNFCTDPEELDRIFSIESWNGLGREEQQRLMVSYNGCLQGGTLVSFTPKEETIQIEIKIAVLRHHL